MQQIQFVREGMNSYMVTSIQTTLKRTSYEDVVMELAEVPNFMNYEIREMDGIQVLYYSLKYRTSLKQVLGDWKLTVDKIKNMIFSIVQALTQSEQFLLNQNYIIWNSECTFVELHTGNMVFTYCPEMEQRADSLRIFLMDIIQYIDKKEQDGYLLLMEFYNLVTNPDCSLKELSQYITNSMEIGKAEKSNCIEKFEQDEPMIQKKYIKVDEKTIADDKRNEVVEKKNRPDESKYIITVVFLTIVNLIEVLLLLFEVWTYRYIWILIISIILLLASLIVLFQTEKEDSPDAIMEEYLTNTEKNMDKEEFLEETYITNHSGEIMETTILMKDDSLQEIVVEDEQKEVYLKSIKQERYGDIIIGKKNVVIGSMESSCDYYVKEKGISRMHAKLLDREDGLYIIDLNSTNGTYLNDEILQCGKEYQLQKGDVVSFAYIAVFVVDEM